MENKADDDVFNEVFNRYYTNILNIAFKSVKDRDAAMDICQEVFTRYIASMDLVQNTHYWLIGTVKNVVFEYYRKKWDDTMPLEDYISDHRMLIDIELREIRIIINDLVNDASILGDEKDRELFYRIAINKKTIRSTGIELNFTENQVRYRYSIIKRKMRETLGSIGIKSAEDIF